MPSTPLQLTARIRACEQHMGKEVQQHMRKQLVMEVTSGFAFTKQTSQNGRHLGFPACRRANTRTTTSRFIAPYSFLTLIQSARTASCRRFASVRNSCLRPRASHEPQQLSLSEDCRSSAREPCPREPKLYSPPCPCFERLIKGDERSARRWLPCRRERLQERHRSPEPLGSIIRATAARRDL